MSRTIFSFLALAVTSLAGPGDAQCQPFGLVPAGAAPAASNWAAERDWLAYLPPEYHGGGYPGPANYSYSPQPAFGPGYLDGCAPAYCGANGYVVGPYYGCEPPGCCAPQSPPCVEVCQPALGSVSISGLLLNIDVGDHYYFSFDDANEARQLTDWHDVECEWDGAFEVAVRCYDDCSAVGLEGVYWQLFADPVATTTSAADVVGNLNGILNWDQLDYNGATADTYVNNALVHRLRREVELQNAELNHLTRLGTCDCSSVRVLGLVGARCVRFEDQLQFAADTLDNSFTFAPEELYYNIDTENLMCGFQAGMWSEYCLGQRCRFVLAAKAGAFGNYVTADSRIGGAAGTATVNNGPNIGRRFEVDVEKTDLAMLGELECDLQVAMTPSWHAGLGYRVMGLSGVASPVDQIYHDLRGLQDVEQIDSDGTLLVHGARAYVLWQF
jgi:hypothetical protein